MKSIMTDSSIENYHKLLMNKIKNDLKEMSDKIDNIKNIVLSVEEGVLNIDQSSNISV